MTAPVRSCCPKYRQGPAAGQQGYTLIELMVAIGILALVALLSWRGLDVMVRAQQGTQARSDQIAVVQTALAQWRTDLDAMLPASTGKQAVLDWDGNTLRVLRLASPDTLESAEDSQNSQQSLWTPATVVVAWTLRNACPRNATADGSHPAAQSAAGSCWMRWQSPQLRTQGEQQQAWQQAASWGSGTQGDAAGSQVMLPLQAWEVLGYREQAWGPVNGTPAAPRPPGEQDGAMPAPEAGSVPDGLRLQLTLPGQGSGLAGTLTLDWLQPTLTRERY